MTGGIARTIILTISGHLAIILGIAGVPIIPGIHLSTIAGIAHIIGDGVIVLGIIHIGAGATGGVVLMAGITGLGMETGVDTILTRGAIPVLTDPLIPTTDGILAGIAPDLQPTAMVATV